VISTQSPPPRPFSVVPPSKIVLSLVDSSPNCRHKLIVVSDGWRGAHERSACRWPPIAIASLLSIRPRRHLIIVIPSSLSSSTTSMLTFPLPHRCCRHCRHHCRWRRCRRCRHRHRHRRLSSSCLSCSLAVNPRNLTKPSQGGIARGMGMECLPLDLP
jgi:hypothetical protein